MSSKALSLFLYTVRWLSPDSSVYTVLIYARVTPIQCPNQAKQLIKLCKLQCSIPHYKDWSQRMSLEALCPSCANYQFQTTELRKGFSV